MIKPATKSSIFSANLLNAVDEIRKLQESQAQYIPQIIDKSTDTSVNEHYIKTKYERERAKQYGINMDPFFGGILKTGIAVLDNIREKAYKMRNAIIKCIVQKLYKCKGRINNLLVDLDKTNKYRAKRLERQAMIENIILVIIRSLDLGNWSIGRLDMKVKKFFAMYSYQHIAKALELAYDEHIDVNGVITRVYRDLSIKRAMRDLKLAGYITVCKQFKKHQTKDGEIRYYGKPSLKTFTKKFFKHMGICMHYLGKQKGKKTKLLREIQEADKRAEQSITFVNVEDTKRFRELLFQSRFGVASSTA